MEVPVLLASDTTENWNSGIALLGLGELAWDIVDVNEDGSPGKKYLLVGDGQLVAPNGAGINGRLRATPEIIQGLAEELIRLQENIEKQPVIHDDTLEGKGIEGDPLSVNPGSFDGLTSRVVLEADGIAIEFSLPEDFLFAKLSIVQINGLIQEPNNDYFLDAHNSVITFTEVPKAKDKVAVYYTRKGEGD